ncbi:glycosyl hydrolase family 18 protein [Neobacillus dielmonensis]|uniref:glycosyl hydrolase family 18 protein n=1 Tax=Neobacillus dielmonensis TaxID=1347369 RepID=UPI0005A5D55F|nr:glycosyl hydrolase family 18 protein [Neobacillus dielmonensis]
MANMEIITQKNSKKWIIGGLISGILLIVSAVILLLYPFPSNEKHAYFKGEHPIIFKGMPQGNAVVQNQSIYLPMQFIQENLDLAIRYDEKSKSVIITTKDKVVQMPTDSLTYFINEQPVSLQLSPIMTMNDQVYISIDSILPFYSFQYTRLQDSDAIIIEQDGDTYTNATVMNKDINEKRLRIRTKPEWQAPYSAQLKRNEAVRIEGEKQDFYFVRKANGMAGYIKKKYIQPGELEKITVAHDTKKFNLPKVNGPINLTWEAVYTKNPDMTKIPEMSGVNVISPTWFSLAGADGSVKNLASLDYSHWAQTRGYQVWGVFSNAFDPELTHQAFKDFETRKNIIRQLLYFSQMYQLQGINFDIENVNQEDGPYITQLMREAAPYLHEAGLVVSMDITFAAGENNNWSSFYERPKLAEIADYLIVMAYDEHAGSSSEAGSVASFPWVENNLDQLLKEVPNDKLILGVPLYTRLWKEQTNSDGTTLITSKALSMDQASEWLAEKGVQPAYDEESGQNYAEYKAPEENAVYKIWMEDESSLTKRANLAVTKNLAGVASWSRLFAGQTAWTALQMTTNNNVTQN